MPESAGNLGNLPNGAEEMLFGFGLAIIFSTGALGAEQVNRFVMPVLTLVRS